LQQLLALEAVAISLHSALVWDIAIGEETSNVNTQASKELRVERAVKIILNILQTISFHVPRHVGGKNLNLFTRDVVREGLLPQIGKFLFCIGSETVSGYV
jgi:hypothetical protein